MSSGQRPQIKQYFSVKTLERCSKPHSLFEKSEAKTFMENFVFLITNTMKNNLNLF